MDEEKTILNVRVRKETQDSIRRLARETHRGIGQTIDWLIADAIDRMNQVAREKVTLDDMLSMSNDQLKGELDQLEQAIKE